MVTPERSKEARETKDGGKKPAGWTLHEVGG